MASSAVFGKCVLGPLETRIPSFVAEAPEMVSTERKLHCWRHGYRSVILVFPVNRLFFHFWCVSVSYLGNAASKKGNLARCKPHPKAL